MMGPPEWPDHDEPLQLEPRAVVVGVHPREEAAREGQALAAALRVAEHEQLFRRLHHFRGLACGQLKLRQRRVRSRRPAFHHAQAPGHAEHREVGARRQRDGVRAWVVRARVVAASRVVILARARVRKHLDRESVLGPPRRLRTPPAWARDETAAFAHGVAAHVLTGEEAIGADAEAAARDQYVPLNAIGAREPARRRRGRRAPAWLEDADRDDREACRVFGEALARGLHRERAERWTRGCPLARRAASARPRRCAIRPQREGGGDNACSPAR